MIRLLEGDEASDPGVPQPLSASQRNLWIAYQLHPEVQGS